MFRSYRALAAVLVTAFPITASGQSDTGVSVAISHPPEVAFVDEGAMGSVYRQTAQSLRLYTFDRDAPNRSVCVEGCASAWPPLVAKPGSEPVGDWTLIDRAGGVRQWAFRGRPVYTRFHDAPDVPTGDGVDGLWHILQHVPSPRPSP